TDQDAKLEMISDAGAILLPSLSPAKTTATTDPAITTRTVDETVQRLQALPNPSPAAKRLGQILSSLTPQPDGIAIMQRTLITGLPALLDALRDALSATHVAFASLSDDLKREWVAPDGRARVQIYPRGASNDNATLVRFISAVRKVEPRVAGVALSVQQSG